MPKYLSPKADLTFKRIFAEHPELLISFLNAVMPLKEQQKIVSIEYLTPELAPDSPGKKYSIVDVRCRDRVGRQFIVEIQTSWYPAFMQRLVFNASKVYVRQLPKGSAYHLLQPVYTLAILDSNFSSNNDTYYHHFKIINTEKTDEVIEGLEFILVELTEKFKPTTTKERELMVLWLRFLNEVNEGLDELPAELYENEDIRQAAELCYLATFTDEELALYDAFWDAVSSEKTAQQSFWEKGLTEGEAIGIEKGEAIGIEKGRNEGEAIGIERGRAEGEHAKAIETAQKLLAAGIPQQIIADCTGLSVGEIQKFVV
jgi:predicted transposase/invertase (TIGR01784 family)